MLKILAIFPDFRIQEFYPRGDKSSRYLDSLQRHRKSRGKRFSKDWFPIDSSDSKLQARTSRVGPRTTYTSWWSIGCDSILYEDNRSTCSRRLWRYNNTLLFSLKYNWMDQRKRKILNKGELQLVDRLLQFGLLQRYLQLVHAADFSGSLELVYLWRIRRCMPQSSLRI